MSAATTVTTAPSGHALPRWASLLLAAGCIAIGLWASVVTLQFFEHGASALESDPALQALAKAAAVLFVFAEMSAFILAALIVGRELMVRRRSLYAYAAVVLSVEVFTISAIQIASVVGADMTQASVSESVIDLRKQIAAAEAQAATYTANAESLRASDQLKKAAQQTDKATAAQDKAAALYAQMGTARAAKRPTLSGMLGEKLAIGYAIVRGLLVPATGLIFFGVAGALMLRRTGPSVEQRILMALSRVEDAPAALPVATMQAAPVVPAVSFKPAGTVPAQSAPALTAPTPVTMPVAPVQAAVSAPFSFIGFKKVPAAPIGFKPAGTVAPSGFSFSAKTMMAGTGALAALTAPISHAAPAAAPVNVDIPKPVNVDIPPPANAGMSSPVNGDVLISPEPVNVDTPSPVNVDTPDAPKKARKPRVVRDGAVMDSGLTEHDGARYRRALAGVKAGKIRPSIAGLAAGVDASAPVARRYLAAMADAGVIAPSGRGFAVVKKGGAA